MSIVRSLLINIGFTTNKKQQKQVLSTINVIKLGFTAAAFAISSAFQRLFSYINELVQFRNQTSDIADSLGLAYNNLLALQRAGTNFRINESQINSLLTTTKDLIYNLGFTASQLSTIQRELKFEVLKNDNPIDVLQKITEGLANIQDRTDAIRLSGNIFGANLATAAVRLGENFDKFREQAKQIELNSPSNEEQLKNLEEYNKAYNSLNLSIQKLTDTLVTNFIGPLTTSINYFTSVLEFYLNLIKGFVNGDFKPFIETSKKIAERTGLDNLTSPSRLFSGNQNRFSITNNIDIKVPAGATLGETVENIPQEIALEIESVIQNVFGNIEFDNPVIE